MKKLKKILISLVGMLTLFMIISYLAVTANEEALTDDIRGKLSGSVVKLEQGSIYYSWHGPENGPVLVLVHGFSTPQFVFDKNVPVFTKAGFRVLVFDHFGRGYSDRPEGTYDEDFFDKEMTDLFAALKITKPVYLLGYSLGGGIATVFTARHPELVKKLILAAPVGFMNKPSGQNALLLVPLLGEYLFAMVGKDSLISDFKREEKQGYATEKMVRLFAEQFRYKGAWKAMLATLRNYPMHNLKSYYQTIGEQKKPVLLLWGTEDESVFFDGAKKVAAAIPLVKLKSFKGVTHSLVYSHSKMINSEIIDFLK